MANWNILMGGVQPHQVAAGVAQGFQIGQEQRRQRDLQDAMRQYATKPDDRNALLGVSQIDPELGIRLGAQQEQRRGQQQKAQLAELERHRDNIVAGARIIRQINPQDEASWQQTRALAAQAGIALDEVPASFDPQYVQNLVKLADALSPQREGGQPPNIQREVDYYRSIGRPELADQLLVRHAEGPPLTVRNEDGTITILPPATTRPSLASPVAPQAGQADPATLRAQADEAIRAGADPAAVNARLEQMLKGGAGQSGPQTF